MRRTRALWLGVCSGLCACAQLGGFEEFREGSSNGGKTASAPGGESGEGGVGAAGKTSTAGKAGGTTAGSVGVSGSTNRAGGAGGAGGDGVGGAPPEGEGGMQPVAGSGPTELLTDCVLLLHFEEASWSMKAAEVRDSSGLGNHGSATTSSITTAAQGKFGGGVVVPDATSLRPRVGLTVTAWVNPTFIETNGSGIVNKRRGFGSDTAFSLFLLRDADPASHLFGDVQGEESRFLSVSPFVPNTWAHVALVFDGSAAPSARSKLYVNGALDITSPEPAAHIEPYTSDVVIGDLVGGGERFTGLIDEVAIWTRALSAAEIHDVFTATGSL
jgi:hypothetical protein